MRDSSPVRGSVRPQLNRQPPDAGRLARATQRLGVLALRGGRQRRDTEGLREREGDRRPPLCLQVDSERNLSSLLVLLRPCPVL